MAAVHCSILGYMCVTIAGIGVETHDLAHPLPTLRVDCTLCTNLYFKWLHCPCATSMLGIPQFKSKFVVFGLGLGLGLGLGSSKVQHAGSNVHAQIFGTR